MSLSKNSATAPGNPSITVIISVGKFTATANEVSRRLLNTRSPAPSREFITIPASLLTLFEMRHKNSNKDIPAKQRKTKTILLIFRFLYQFYKCIFPMRQ